MDSKRGIQSFKRQHWSIKNPRHCDSRFQSIHESNKKSSHLDSLNFYTVISLFNTSKIVNQILVLWSTWRRKPAIIATLNLIKSQFVAESNQIKWDFISTESSIYYTKNGCFFSRRSRHTITAIFMNIANWLLIIDI